MRILSKIYVGLIFFFLYAPILVLIIFSFSGSSSTANMFSRSEQTEVVGTVEEPKLSLKWYKELFNDSETIDALKNTLVLAVLSSSIATVIGTAAAVGINKMKNRYAKSALLTVTNIPMMNPDIVTGVSLMLLFAFVGVLINVKILGFWTLLIAHVTFNLPYVILSVLPKLKQMDKHLPEAAMDLGCTPVSAFFKVELPAIRSGVITGLIMAFTLSLDDFVISYFASGSSFQTLPIRIYSMTKKRVTPDMYALSTIIFVVILLLLILINFRSKDDNKKKTKKTKEIEN